MKKYEYGRLSSRIINLDINWFFSYGYTTEKELNKNQDILEVMNTLGCEGWRFSLEENDYGQHEKDYITYRELTNE